jgi:hypothetical protein
MSLPKPLTAALVLLVMTLTVREITGIVDRKPQRETISVQGQATVPLIPDVAQFELGLVTESPAPGEVLRASEQTARTAIAVLTSNGIEPTNIVQTAFNLGPKFDYADNKPPRISGYRVQQAYRVRVPDFNLAPKVLDAVRELNPDRIDGPAFVPADPERARTRARREAFAEARARALSLTIAAGVQLGRVVSFTEAAGAPPGLAPGTPRPDESGSAGEPQSISVSVEVVYEIH